MELSYKIKNKDERNHPLKWWGMSDDTAVAIYQGFRSSNPELDLIVDLLVKCAYNKDLVKSYVEYLLQMYEEIGPFHNPEDRNTYSLKYVPTSVVMFGELDNAGYYSIQMLTTLVELFCKCEKQTTGAFMFKRLLNLVKEYCEDKKDFYQIVGYSKRV